MTRFLTWLRGIACSFEFHHISPAERIYSDDDDDCGYSGPCLHCGAWTVGGI